MEQGGLAPIAGRACTLASARHFWDTIERALCKYKISPAALASLLTRHEALCSFAREALATPQVLPCLRGMRRSVVEVVQGLIRELGVAETLDHMLRRVSTTVLMRGFVSVVSDMSDDIMGVALTLVTLRKKQHLVNTGWPIFKSRPWLYDEWHARCATAGKRRRRHSGGAPSSPSYRPTSPAFLGPVPSPDPALIPPLTLA